MAELMEWISVDKYLPGKKVNWVIVRCINSDLYDFYFMANYYEEWSFFDDDENRHLSMKITHWAIPDNVNEKDFFIETDGNVITEKN